MNYSRIVAAVMLWVLSLPCVASEESLEFAQMGRAAWAAFGCSSLAAKAGMPEEQARLFEFGYKTGKEFIAAVQANKVRQEHLVAESPMFMLMLLEGPTGDFMLGRIYEFSQESVLKEVYKTGGQLNPETVQKMVASTKFNNKNCSLIGR